MTETYRKRGRVVRLENGYLVDSSESGMAIEDGESFSCEPAEGEPLAPIHPAGIRKVAQDIEDAVASTCVHIERLIVSEGVAEHELGERRWNERIARVHLSLVYEGLRALIDLGAERVDALLSGDIAGIARALASADEERDPPPRLRLAPPVVAAALPHLGTVSGARILQWPAGDRRDGKGNRVERASGEPWPNWFRPSYRTPPARMPFDLRLQSASSEVPAAAPRAIALLQPPEGPVLRVLCVDGEAAFPATVTIRNVLAVAGPQIWYPYGAGAWGSETLI